MKSLKDLVIDVYAKLGFYRFSGTRERVLGAISKQDDGTSYELHHSEYIQKDALERIKRAHDAYERDNLFNDPCLRFEDLLNKYPAVRETAVDIGCGTGWLSAKLSKQFAKVVGIEPSDAAISMAKQLFPPQDYPNIEWKIGFAEKELNSVSSEKPMAFFTSTVLSHLKDDAVIKICDSINNCAPKGSILGFSECWGTKSYSYMWYIRTKEWWQEKLPDWEIDFFGPDGLQKIEGRHKGFHAIKIKD